MNVLNTHDNFKVFSEFYEKQLQTISLPDKLAGSFTLKSCLKQSEHREIYLVADDKENLYILKKQSGKQLPQLKQEQHIFEILHDAKDLTIPRYIDCWEEQEYCYLLRTYIEGCSLSDYFNRRLYLSDKEIIHYMLAICDLISTLHHQQPPVIHRDIKPENFIIQKGTGTLYLIDFDTARVYTPDKSRDTMLVGTPSHAAPEQFGFSQSDVRTDIYALGKTLLYLTCGNTEIVDLKSSSIAKPFQKMIAHCTDFTPDKRYSDISQLIHSLKGYQRRLHFSTSNARQLLTAILLLALGSCLGYAVHFIQKEQSPANMLAAIGNSDNDSQMDIPLSDTTDVSLFEQSGVMEYRLSEFQDTADRIILDYYHSDTDALARDCESLVKALSEDAAINQADGSDHAGSDSLPEFQAPIMQIRNSLAYRDHILTRKLGSYDKYKDAIYMNINGILASEPPDEECCLYIYATSTGENASNNYEMALCDILNMISLAFDQVDGVEASPLD